MVSSSLNSPSLGDGHRERDPDPDRLDAVVDPVKEQIEPPRAEAFGLEHFAEPAGELARGALREGGVRCLDKLSEFLSFAVVMRILIFHGYLLRGTGSNIYNANLARALAGLGHEVHLFCQDRSAQEPEGVTIHVPDIGRVLPVYVSDRYEGFDAVPFPELDDEALGHYLDANVVAVRSVPSPEIALANHLVMGPVILARGLEGRAPYAVEIHGSALEYTIRPHRERFLPYAREGIIGASGVLVGSRHTAESLWEVFSDEPSLPERTRLGPPGVNVSSFRPRRDAEAAIGLTGLADKLTSGGIVAWGGEAGAGKALRELDPRRDRIVSYVGKLIVSKGVDLLLAAWPLVVARVAEARLVVVGFGRYREALGRFVDALGRRDLEMLHEIGARGRELEGGPAGELRLLRAFLANAPEEWLDAAPAAAACIHFTGRIEHDDLPALLPVCEAQVMPSTFPEARHGRRRGGSLRRAAAIRGTLRDGRGHRRTSSRATRGATAAPLV